MPDAEKLAAVREALPALSAGIYLNSGALGPLPSETAAAMDEYAGRELRTGRGHPDDIEAGIERMAEARAGVAAILAAHVDEIALTHGAAEALAAAIDAIDWRPGDRLLTTRHEDAAILAAVAAVCDRFGVEIDTAEVAGDGDDDSTVAAFEAALRPGTRLVLASHVLATTGARLPVERIAAVAHERGALLALDGAQSVGAIPVVADETGADFFAVAGEKWLLGPEGMGALWVSPANGGGPSPVSTTGPARRLAASGFHKPSVVGFARSCGWLSMYVGLPWIHARGTSLARWAADRLAAIAGVGLVTPRDRMATIVTFRIGGWTADEAVAELGARVFAIAGTVQALDAIRIGVGFFNTEAEVERFAGAVELLAAHTPATLPPKPRLAILGQDDR